MRFSTPAPKKKFQYDIDNFLGIDLSTAPNNVAKNRSPFCPNMVRDTVGKVRKRDGITLVKSFAGSGDGKINGVHFLYGSTNLCVIHTGTNMYLDGETPTLLYSTAENSISVSKQINGKLYILDGKKYLCFNGTTITPVENTSYVPTIIIARTPTGGGTLLEPINLINKWRTEMFAGTSSATVYQLTATSIDADLITVKKMDSGGVFQTLTLTTDYTVDRTLGQVTFVTAPGVSPITGEDNIQITYAKTVTGYADRINKCDVSVLYGMSGARDRLFVSGNPDFPHYDWYSNINDPTYFADLNYSVIGQDNAAIVNYSIVNDYLVTHKNDAENGDNSTLRRGSLVDGKVVFATQGSYQTSGALAKYSFANLENEPLYVTTERNVSAVTPSDVLGERFSQERSYYITEVLKTETGLENAFAYSFDGFYCLAVGTKLYLLDGLQYAPNRERPFSHRQYECYLFTGVGATVLWEQNNELYFGTADGKIKRFQKDSPNDEGQPIVAYWDTPEFDGNSFADKKTFTYVAARLAAAPRTGVRVSARVSGIWSVVMDYNNEAQYFDFSDINFDEFTFNTDTTPHTLGRKIKIKNVDKVQFRFENSKLGESFGIYKALLEYTEGNKYRK